MLAQVDPTIYQAQYDQAVAKKAQDEATLVQCPSRSRSLRSPRRDQCRPQATGGYPEGARCSTRSAGQIRSGQHRQSAGLSGLHQDRCADLGAHRHPAGRCRQYRARLEHDADCRDHAVAPDLDHLHVAATATRSGHQGARQPGRSASTPSGQINQTSSRTEPCRLSTIRSIRRPARIKLKAQFANKDLRSGRGSSSTCGSLVDTLRQVVVVPTAAVQRGPNGPFVFVVGDDNKVAMHPVTVTQQDEAQSVITSGVQKRRPRCHDRIQPALRRQPRQHRQRYAEVPASAIRKARTTSAPAQQ